MLPIKKERFYFFLATFIGGGIGFFLLYPINEFVYFLEHNPSVGTAKEFVLGQLSNSLKGDKPLKTAFYVIVGGALGSIIFAVFNILQKRLFRISELSESLGKDIGFLIYQGEGPSIEFKSSFRWDLKQSKVNNAMVNAVLKTIAGYMNSKGGTLLIGVSDNKEIIGLENDYKTLKRGDRDGFEQAIITAVSTSLGTDLCKFIQIVFHSIGGNDVCRIIISSSPRPVFVGHGKERKFYLRTGGGTRDLDIKEAMEYAYRHWKKK